jgi:pyruvate/2-oxoglutarate dehydrogenase complex dihydrolipoamide dehydrogenase (E3) component
MERQDLVVIGGGTSGFIVAAGALRLGLKVCLIDKSSILGGSALHFGCVPSKTLLHVAQVVHTIQHSNQYGLQASLAPIAMDKINAHINGIVRVLEKQEELERQYLFKQAGGKILLGHVKFIDPHTLQLNDTVIATKKVVIATGSRSLLPDIKGLDEVGYHTHSTIFELNKLPQKLIILGDKPSAVEFAQAFARFGSKVTLVVRGDSILPQEDPELVKRLKEILVSEGIELYLNTSVQAAYLQKSNKYLDCVHDSGDKFSLFGDEILVALGRRPNVEGLGLENAAIEYTEEGILVNKKLRTSQKHIYALGDVIHSPYKLTHAAEYQASIVLSNAVFRYPAKTKYQGFPYVIFTSPEYAHVGLSEAQAIAQGFKNINVTRFEFKDLDSAILQSAEQGLIKIITHKGKIIGATILGAQASNLIAEWGLAINMGANIRDVASTIHAYPTLAQINRRVASKHASRGFFGLTNRRIVSFLQHVFA